MPRCSCNKREQGQGLLNPQLSDSTQSQHTQLLHSKPANLHRMMLKPTHTKLKQLNTHPTQANPREHGAPTKATSYKLASVTQEPIRTLPITTKRLLPPKYEYGSSRGPRRRLSFLKGLYGSFYIGPPIHATISVWGSPPHQTPAPGLHILIYHCLVPILPVNHKPLKSLKPFKPALSGFGPSPSWPSASSLANYKSYPRNNQRYLTLNHRPYGNRECVECIPYLGGLKCLKQSIA